MNPDNNGNMDIEEFELVVGHNNNVISELALLQILSELITDPTTDPVTYHVIDLEKDDYYDSHDYEKETETKKSKKDKKEPTEKLLPLLDLIKAIIESETESEPDILVIQKRYDIEITYELLSVLSLMSTADPAFFLSIENTFTEIVKGNKIDARDVPNIMALLINLYTILAELKFKPLNTQICGSVLKFIIAVIIKDKIVRIDNDNEKELMLCLALLINSCIELTTLSNKIKKTKSRFNPFAGCFTF
jgi:hypothetical protein